MPKRFLKFKLLLDEGFFERKRLPRLNKRHNVKHIKIDLGKESIPDIEVYKEAVKSKRLIVTFNGKDFKQFAGRSKDSGVIAVTHRMVQEDIDKKLVSLLSKYKKRDLYGKFVSISNSGIVFHEEETDQSTT